MLFGGNWKPVISVAGFILLSGCAASIEQEGLNLSGDQHLKGKPDAMVKSDEMRNITKYRSDGKIYQVEYFSCHSGSNKKTALLVNLDQLPFQKGMCDDWLSQSFLRQDFDVIGVNRPGFGASQPQRQDFGGPQSRDAIGAVFGSYDAQKSKPIEGIWGVGTGAIAASFIGKKSDQLSWMILGNGIYDFEDFFEKSEDHALKKLAEDAKKIAVSEEAFVELRSISWDMTGLPTIVLLYHAKSNPSVGISQAQAFRDSLAAAERRTYLEEVEGIKHNIDPLKHALVLKRMLEKLNEMQAKSKNG